jgi:dienelactone hydrolase
MRIGSVAALVLACTVTGSAVAQVTNARYARADAMQSHNAEKLVLRDGVRPNWIRGSDRFWYRVTTQRGSEFILVDPARRLRRPAFDHQRLATTLAGAADTAVVADSLPFQTLTWEEEGKATRVVVVVKGKSWRCDLGTYRCDSTATPKPPDPNELLSPDGKWALFRKDYNLWIRNTATDERRALTTDGERRNDYASRAESNTNSVTSQRLALPQPPVALWSGDSKRILTHRLDQRGVRELHLVQSVHRDGLRPKLWSFGFPYPGDSVLPMASWRVFEAETRRMVAVDAPATSALDVPLLFGDGWWGDSAGTVGYVLDRARGAKSFTVRSVDPVSGASRTIAEERGPTMVEPAPLLGLPPLIRVLGGGREVVWYSERDGWSSLYLLDGATGQVKNRVTDGPWVVRELLRVDEAGRKVWFAAGGREPGRDPYYRHLYSVNLDGTGLTLLSPEDADHQITASPSGAWFLDRFSRVDLTPTTVLRSADGKIVLPLEQADISRLLATGWRYPERFTTKAADDTTTLYGIIIRPSDFDSTKRYPVVEEIYPGPQVNKVPKGFEPGSDHRSIVELGFIGVQIDGRGTPLRSKAFHDYSYGRLENGGGLEDHVAAYRQLGARHRYLDVDRIGIYGHSGGGFASARAMMLYPDTYKVAVSSAGNHDQRGYLSLWGETYHGMPNGDNYLAQANPTIAKNLRGKLMLAFGEMDDNVPPALTIQLIDALTKANKDYDLVIVPNGHHGMMASGYFKRRRWDYFVEHLMGVTPPSGYELKSAPSVVFEK